MAMAAPAGPGGAVRRRKRSLRAGRGEGERGTFGQTVASGEVAFTERGDGGHGSAIRWISDVYLPVVVVHHDPRRRLAAHPLTFASACAKWARLPSSVALRLLAPRPLPMQVTPRTGHPRAEAAETVAGAGLQPRRRPRRPPPSRRHRGRPQSLRAQTRRPHGQILCPWDGSCGLNA